MKPIFHRTVTSFATLGLSFPLSFLSPILAQDAPIETDCIHALRGQEKCQIEYVSETEGLRIYWQNGLRDHIREGNEAPLQIWDHQQGIWTEASTLGFCWDGRCVEAGQPEEEELANSFITGTCIHPLRGRGSCQLENVPETNGVRVDWQDGTVDHIRFTFNEETNNLFLIWNHQENRWSEVDDIGICINGNCIVSLPTELLNLLD